MQNMKTTHLEMDIGVIQPMKNGLDFLHKILIAYMRIDLDLSLHVRE